MRPLYSGFLSFARQRYAGLSWVLDEVVARLRPEADIEDLLQTLSDASHADKSAPAGTDVDLLANWADGARRLRAHLLAYVVEQCERFDRELTVSRVGPLLNELSARDGMLFTTNYDRLIEYAAESSNLLVRDGFAPGELVGPWQGDFEGHGLSLYKLHGSVTWYRTTGETDEFIRLDRGYPLPGPEFRLSREGVELEPLMIVPTLEKDALAQPYSHLLMHFNGALAASPLAIVVGSSLRDAHLVSVLTFQPQRRVVVIVGHAASVIANRLHGVRTIAIDTSSDAFLQFGVDQLGSLFDSVDEASDPDTIAIAAQAFASTYQSLVTTHGALTAVQRAALGRLKDKSPIERIRALNELRDVRAPEVETRVIELIADQDPQVRSAACAALASYGTTAAVASLGATAGQDSDPSVRLEASLALHRIATPEATAALESRARARPDDRFVEIALTESAQTELAASQTSRQR